MYVFMCGGAQSLSLGTTLSQLEREMTSSFLYKTIYCFQRIASTKQDVNYNVLILKYYNKILINYKCKLQVDVRWNKIITESIVLLVVNFKMAGMN